METRVAVVAEGNVRPVYIRVHPMQIQARDQFNDDRSIARTARRQQSRSIISPTRISYTWMSMQDQHA